MSNSILVNVKNLSPNCNKPRNHRIDTITIHCFVGQVTAERGTQVFLSRDKNASCNYVVGKDGDVGLVVDEANRSWCSSNAVNDNRAITIEVASDNFHPYAVTEEAFMSLIQLVADICKRNNIPKLVWSENKNDRINHLNGCNMTVHRDFANKACPGEYLYSRMGEIAERVNYLLKETNVPVIEKDEVIESSTTYIVKPGDNLSKIAKGLNVEMDKLLEVNPQIVNPNVIFVGQEINIPETIVKVDTTKGTRDYTVVKGDNLTKIASKFCNTVTPEEIYTMNGPAGTKTVHKKMTMNYIVPGWKFKI